MMPPKPSYKRGDVVLVLYPNSDWRTAKTRPALLVRSDDLQTGLPQVIVAMITSRLFRANYQSRVADIPHYGSDCGEYSSVKPDAQHARAPR